MLVLRLRIVSTTAGSYHNLCNTFRVSRHQDACDLKLLKTKLLNK